MDNFYKASEIIKQRFIQIPKVILYHDRYEGLSASCILAYGILRDRFELSIANGWIDKDDNIYMVFDRKELGKILRVKRAAASKYIKELESYDLLLDKRMGLNKANRIYMKKPITDSKYIYESKQNSLMYEKDTSKKMLRENQEVSKEYTNDTDFKDTDYIDTQSSLEQNDRPTDFKNIIDKLQLDTFNDARSIEQAIRILYYSDKPLRLNNMNIPQNQVREDMKRLTSSCIESALSDYEKASREQEIGNVTSYLSRCIYNSIFDSRLKIDSDLRYKNII